MNIKSYDIHRRKLVFKKFWLDFQDKQMSENFFILYEYSIRYWEPVKPSNSIIKKYELLLR